MATTSVQTVRARNNSYGGGTLPRLTFVNDVTSLNSVPVPVADDPEKTEDYEYRVDELKHHLSQLQQDYDLLTLRTTNSNTGDLDISYHEKEVFIVLACPPHTALDFGGNGGTSIHGYDFNRAHVFQSLRLRRVSPTDQSNVLWTISSTCTNRYLAVNPNSGAIEAPEGRAADGEARLHQEWLIHLNGAKTGYYIESKPKGKLQMASPREVCSGKIVSQSFDSQKELSYSQVWHILLK